MPHLKRTLSLLEFEFTKLEASILEISTPRQGKGMDMESILTTLALFIADNFQTTFITDMVRFPPKQEATDKDIGMMDFQMDQALYFALMMVRHSENIM